MIDLRVIAAINVEIIYIHRCCSLAGGATKSL
jgi:hypothetical protein